MSGESNHLMINCLHLTLDIYKEIVKTESANVVVSPMSLGVTLSMVYAGSKNRTEDELNRVLHLANFPEKSSVHEAYRILIESIASVTKVNVYMVSAVYLKDEIPIDENFQKVLLSNYHSKVENVSFDEKTRKKINTWGEIVTNEKVKDLVPEGTFEIGSASVVLVSAMSFRGDWKNPFDTKRTQPGKFYVDSKTEIWVQMMFQENNFHYAYNENMHCKLLELPYVDENMVMHLLLPDDKEGLPKLEETLTPEILSSMIADAKEYEVTAYLPKFKIEWGGSVSELLSKLGLSVLFNAGEADLSSLCSTGESVYVSVVLHKAVIEVTENGTEPAMTEKSTSPLVFSGACAFIADHPFLFTVYDKRTQTVLLIGRMTGQTEADIINTINKGVILSLTASEDTEPLEAIE